MAKGFTRKQQRFIAEYPKDCNGTQAAIRAGYSAKCANEQAAYLLANPSIRAAVDAEVKKVTRKAGMTAEWILRKLRSTILRCASAVPVLDRDGNETGEWKFDATNVMKGLELAGRNLGLWDKKQSDGSDDVAKARQQLLDALKRDTQPAPSC